MKWEEKAHKNADSILTNLVATLRMEAGDESAREMIHEFVVGTARTAYQEGARDMRERAAGHVDALQRHYVLVEPDGDRAARYESVAMSIRALPLSPDNGEGE